MKHLIVLAGLLAAGVASAAEAPKPVAPAGAPTTQFSGPGPNVDPRHGPRPLMPDGASRAEWHKEMRGDMRKYHEAHFAEVKQEMLARNEAHSAQLSQTNACVKAAASPDALRACHEAAHAQREAMKEKFQAEHQARHQERQAYRQDRQEQRQVLGR